MTLLVLAIAYIIGVGLGSLLVQAGLARCDLPHVWWVTPLLLLPLTPLLSHIQPHDETPLRWPEHAGFVRPRHGVATSLVVAALLCMVAGALRLVAEPRPGCWTATDLAAWNLPSTDAFERTAPQVTVVGYISNFPTVDNERQEVVVTAQRMRPMHDAADTWHPVAGRVRLLAPARPTLSYGQVVEVTGRLATPPDFADFSYRAVLARQGIHSHFYDAQVNVLDVPAQGAAWRRGIYAVRTRALALLERMLPEPYAALAAGILLGVDAGIPDALYDRFNATGTSHVLVISGSNVALIAALLLALGRRVLGRWASVVAVIGIAAYAVLVGAEASVLRAAVMGALVVVAAGVGRRTTALISLGVACWAMLLVNPYSLYDVGFQLSAAATLGLILFSPLLMGWLTRIWPDLRGGLLTGAAESPPIRGVRIGVMAREIIVDGGVMTVAASVLTLPLVAFHFQRVSALGLLVNLLIVPVQPLILVAGTVALVSDLAGLAWVAQVLLWVAGAGLVWTVRLVEVAAQLPGASWELDHYDAGALLLTYAGIALIFVSTTRKPKLDLNFLQPRRLASLAGLGVLALVATLLWAAVLTLPDGRLHLYFLDVGQGDGILLVTPSGRQVLIDGGVGRAQLLAELGEVMPWWDRKLDMALLTHADNDHMGAQLVMPERFAIDYALASPITQYDPEAAAWQQAMAGGGAAVVHQQRGGWIDLGDGVALWVLWPDATPLVGDDAQNENSLVTKLVYGEFSALLTGDAGIPAESVWLAEQMPLAATVLKVGHHGSKSSTSAGFVAAVDPQWAVIQVGAENTYGHPAPEVLEVLAGRTILRNDEAGRIHFATNGRDVWVETAR